MIQRFALFLGSTALAATLTLTAAAQEYSNGTGAINARGRGPAVLTPVEAFGVHPPGPDPAYKRKIFFRRWRFTFHPYYAPVSPTASSVRWKPWCYFPLLPYYTPYYIGYCPHRLHNPKPLPYGFDGGWGPGPMPSHDPGPPPLRYGIYTSVIQDDTIFWNMGGNGLVPYGAPRPPHLNNSPDLVDMIQVTRAEGGGGSGPGCQACSNGAPVTALNGVTPPEIMPPATLPNQEQGEMGNKESKEASAEEKPAPPE